MVLTNQLIYLVNVKTIRKIFSNYVCFSKSSNFKDYIHNIQRINTLFSYCFQFFVFLLSMLMTIQQALTSGYLNSVITTIEKRYEIPSSISGIIASMYEIGNVVTVIFVSYLGSRRHIPIWIGMGK